MVKKSTLIFTVLAMLAFGACTCWGYTATQWPVPGIPNTVYGPGSASIGNAGYGEYGQYGGYGGYGAHGGYVYPGYTGGYNSGYGTGYDVRGWGR
jgi:hypothetical protein